MSDHLSAEQRARIQARLDAANTEMDRLTESNPATAWRWSIPAQPERDSDLILSAPLADVRSLLAHAGAQAEDNALLNRLLRERIAMHEAAERTSAEQADRITSLQNDLWPAVAHRNAALNRAEAAEQAVRRVREAIKRHEGSADSDAYEDVMEVLEGGQE